MQGGPVATVERGFCQCRPFKGEKTSIPEPTPNGCGVTEKEVIEDPRKEAKCGGVEAKKKVAHL